MTVITPSGMQFFLLGQINAKVAVWIELKLHLKLDASCCERKKSKVSLMLIVFIHKSFLVDKKRDCTPDDLTLLQSN